ncbi:hypothetical protein GCM10010270_12970 [Streptomyces violaceus]|nr:hypothetical protein GCM10010270_12970 [Streptomyces janthinus]
MVSPPAPDPTTTASYSSFTPPAANGRPTNTRPVTATTFAAALHDPGKNELFTPQSRNRIAAGDDLRPAQGTEVAE